MISEPMLFAFKEDEMDSKKDREARQWPTILRTVAASKAEPNAPIAFQEASGACRTGVDVGVVCNLVERILQQMGVQRPGDTAREWVDEAVRLVNQHKAVRGE